MANDLTIVMYHYVRDPEKSAFPGIKGRRIGEFRAQLRHILENYTPVSVADVVASVRAKQELPPRAALLTFDDGYAEHYHTVFPILADVGVPGAFFPPVSPVRDGRLLDVNRIHFLVAVADPAALGAEIDAAVQAGRADYGLKSPQEYRSEWAKATRFDSAEVIYVKRMLQVALPPDLRGRVSADLFSRHVSVDERGFAGDLYVTPEQLATMQGTGMYVGSHGATHEWLNRMDRENLRVEVDSSLEFLRGIGSPVDDYWVMCYPYGAWSDDLLELLRERRCTLGLTTEVAVARIGRCDPLLLPRIDTNDLPVL